MVRALVLEREKRSTAGTRMSTLVGQAAKDDEEFWSHSTWGEEKGNVSDDASFHESDEESDAKVDVFDSDFDESEEEEEEEEEGAEAEGGGQTGNAAPPRQGSEAALLKEEQREKRAVSKRKRMDMEMGMSRDLRLMLQKRKQEEGVDSTTSPSPSSSRKNKIKHSVASGLVGKRSLRTSTINNSIATSTAQLSRQQQSQSQSQSSTTGKARHKQKYTQEELLMEAVSKTEPENKRWLLNRKRLQMEEHLQAETIQKISQLYGGGNKKVVSKFHSRRGCFNTITFPEMDHVPEIFTRGIQMTQEQRDQMMEQIQKESTCVITGKKARYRDPKTNLGYYDLATFKELRRRLEAGEKLESDHRLVVGRMATCDNVKTIQKPVEQVQPQPQPQPETQQQEYKGQNDMTITGDIVPQQHLLDPIHELVKREKDETVQVLPNIHVQSMAACTNNNAQPQNHHHHKEGNGNGMKSLHTFGKFPNSTTFSENGNIDDHNEKSKIPLEAPSNDLVVSHENETKQSTASVILPSQDECTGEKKQSICPIKGEPIHERYASNSKTNQQNPSYNIENHKLKSCGNPVSAEMTSHSNKSQMPLEQPQHG